MGAVQKQVAETIIHKIDNLYYSRGNFSQYSVITYMGK